MYRKNYLIGFLTIALFLIGSTAVFAQTTGNIAGRIETLDASGKATPVQGALVEVFRLDIKSKFSTDTTDKKGHFAIAGLPLGGQFAIAVSAPGFEPTIQPGIKPGQDNIVVPLKTGDGKRYSEEEVRGALAGGGATTPTSEMTADQKKAKEEYDKKVAEIADKNKKIESANSVMLKALEEGNAAFAGKNYDTAIIKYEEGYQANPDYIGSAPVMLNNKGTALRLRAVDAFNGINKITDTQAKVAAQTKVQQDLADAVDAYNKSWTMLKGAPPAEVKDPEQKMKALNGARETFRIMSITRLVDTTKTELAKNLMAEYMTVETDQAKKTEAQRILGDIYLASGELDSAVAEYKKVLAINPSDADALAGIGFSMVSIGAMTKEAGDAVKAKEQYQEAINYLQKFIDSAPANHKYLADAKSSIEDVKKEQNVQPQKVTTKKKN